MGNKNKTISFRVSQEKFETLRDIAEERDISLSAVFRDYVDMLVAHDGQVEVVAEHEVGESESTTESFPPKVEVPRASSASTSASNSRPTTCANNSKSTNATSPNSARNSTRRDDDEDVVQLEDPTATTTKKPPTASAASKTSN